MKAFKKGLALIVSVSLIASLGASAFALTATPTPISAPVGIEPISATMPETLPQYLQAVATVKAPLSNDQLLVEIEGQQIALNTSSETLVIDTKTGLPSDLSKLKAGDLVYAYYSPAMTRSLPPQSFATALVTGVEKDKSHATLFIAKEVVSRTDKEVRLLNQEGDLIVTITKDSPLTPFKTKQIVALDDLKVGSQMFIWYEIVALSYPGQTGSLKTVYVGQTEIQNQDNGVKAVVVPAKGLTNTSIKIEGKAINLGKFTLKEQNGQIMVPLRSVAEALGFKVTWMASTQSVLLDNGSAKTEIYIGQDSYYKASSQAIGLTQSFELGAKPTLINGSTYVPVAIFNLLYSNNEAVILE